jgi:hypothetical protein
MDPLLQTSQPTPREVGHDDILYETGGQNRWPAESGKSEMTQPRGRSKDVCCSQSRQ